MNEGEQRPQRRSWPYVLLAAVLAVVLVGGLAFVLWPSAAPGGTAAPSGIAQASPSAMPSLPGTPGHFDDGEFSFDYPTDWPVLAGSNHGATGALDVLAVLGIGNWKESCQSGAEGTMSWFQCGTDSVDVPPGGVVVKVYLWYGGPAVPCRGDTQANATFGSLAVRKIVDGTVTSWEIRFPGNEFGQPNNVFVEAHTSNPTELARAEQLVGSFRWLETSGSYGCSAAPPTGPPGPS